MFKKIIANPLHFVIGFALSCMGIDLIRNRHYWVYPPSITTFTNDDAVGTVILIIGLSILFWVIAHKPTSFYHEVDNILLIPAAVSTSFVGIYQLIQTIATNQSMPWYMTLSLLLIIEVVAYRR